MSNIFWICRHGKTEWNNQKIKQGHMDSPLSKEGLVQVNMLRIFFKDIKGELYSSPLGRALYTSKKIISTNPELTIHIDDRLKEISFGILEGKSKYDIDTKYHKLLTEFQKDTFNYSFPLGESYTDLLSRAKSFLSNLPLTQTNIIIIAHEDINRMILVSLLKLPSAYSINISQPNNIIYKVSSEKVININLDNKIEKNGLILLGDSE